MTLAPERAPAASIPEQEIQDDPFKEAYGFKLGEQVTVSRTNGAIETDWRVRGYRLSKDGEIEVDVAKPDITESGEENGILVKTYSPAELKALQEPNNAEIDETDPREVSPLGSSVVRAAERVKGLLERHAINKAHGEALDEYRNRDHSRYVDHLANLKDSEKATPMARINAKIALNREYLKSDREKLMDKAKQSLRGVGRSALRAVTKFGDKVGDSMMAAGQKVEGTLDKVGAVVESAKTNRQTHQFERQMAADRRASAKEYAEQTRQLEKDRARQEKDMVKQDKLDAKQAKKDLKDYNKILDQKERADARRERKAAAITRRTERRQRWANRIEAVKEAIISTPDRIGDAMMSGFGKLENGMDKVGTAMVNGKEAMAGKVERGKASVHAKRAAGRAALEAFKTTHQAHTEQNKLY